MVRNPQVSLLSRGHHRARAMVAVLQMLAMRTAVVARLVRDVPGTCVLPGTQGLAVTAPEPQHDLSQYDPEQLNEVADVLTRLYGFIPVDLRYQAAASALDRVRRWVENEPAFRYKFRP